MKSYPYIGEHKINPSGLNVLFFERNNGVVIDGDYKGDNFNHGEEYFKNITAEYLANTYGEVKSKEHAEFIVELAKNHGAICQTDINYSKCKFFYFSSTGDLFFTKEKVSDLATDYKQITIPLPPECESVDEWPKVGSSVEWGHTGKGEVKSLSDGFAWIKLDNKDYTTVYVSSLRKPKTPEQELRDEISDLAFNQFNDDSYDLTHNSYYLAEQLISKYNITKKPQ